MFVFSNPKAQLPAELKVPYGIMGGGVNIEFSCICFSNLFTSKIIVFFAPPPQQSLPPSVPQVGVLLEGPGLSGM